VNPKLAGPLDGFLSELTQTGGRAANTVATYRQTLVSLGTFLDAQGLTDWNGLDAEQLRHWLASRSREGIQARTLARDLSAIRSFYRHLLRRKAATHNPATLVRPPKGARRLPVTLDVDRMSEALGHPAQTPDRVLDQAILELLYSSALRLSELVALDEVDLDLDSGLVRVLGKGSRERIVPVGSRALDALRAWRSVRSGWAAPDESALFVTQRGTRIAHRTVQARLSRFGIREGVGVHLHPHLFRHSCASHLLESSGDLRGLQEFLGHQHLATTQIYTHLDFQHLAAVYDRAHPRARRRNHPAPKGGR